jgi:hypothetical protein
MEMPLFWSMEYFEMRKPKNGIRLIFTGENWKESDSHEYLETYPTITIQLDNHVASSPASASYGGIFIPESYSNSEINIVDELVEHLIKIGMSRIEVYLAPEHLSYNDMLPIETYIKAGFEVNFVNVNHYIDMSQWKRGDMSKGNRKKSRQALGSSFKFLEATDDDFSKSYELIVQNRLAFGAKVPLTFEEMTILFKNFPEKYRCFALKSVDSELVAAAFLVETSPENLYVHLWADSIKFRALSPVVFLMEKLIDYSSQDYRFLDLGTSGVDGIVIDGLVRFKNNLGARTSKKRKIVWEHK